MELLGKRKLPLPVVVLGSFALGAGVVLGAQAAREPSPSVQAVLAFEQDYTDAGKCLDGTHFDPSDGAVIGVTYDRRSDQEILVDTSLGANSLRPPVLSFSVNPGDQLLPSDQATDAYLAQADCPGLPQGS